jgi:hypothetical protein
MFLIALSIFPLDTEWIKNRYKDQAWWYTPVVPSTQEVETGRITVKPALAKRTHLNKIT